MKNLTLGALCAIAALIATAASGQTPPPTRIMSWNVHNCIGTDGVRDYDRVASVIADAAPDVVAVQELDQNTIRVRADVLGEIASRTGMIPTFGAAIRFPLRYGIGILSRQMPLRVRKIRLPGREERRLLLIAEFEHYVLCCTHFSLTEKSRLKSSRKILDAVSGYDKPVILAGDMNDRPDSSMQEILTGGEKSEGGAGGEGGGAEGRFTLLSDPTQATFPGSGECIDMIYGLRNGARYDVTERQVIDQPVASDHLPLYVDVEMYYKE